MVRLNNLTALRAHTTNVACAAFLVACGGDAGTGQAVDPNDALLIDTLPDDRQDIGADATEPDTRQDANDADSSDSSADTTPPEIDIVFCRSDEDCPDSRCVFPVPAYETGVCAIPCINDEDCGPDARCQLLESSGADQVRVCLPDELCIDADGDGWGEGPDCSGRDCDDQLTEVNFGAIELCDGLDNNCNEDVDEDTREEGRVCETGFSGDCATGVQTCRDSALTCEPITAPVDEICDDIDNDCNGIVDDNPTDVRTWFQDLDGDQFGNPTVSATGCEAPEGYVAAGTDCDDNATTVNPSAVEACDGVDNNCVDGIDEGSPGAGEACVTGVPGECATGISVCADGALGCTQTVSPVDELCDGLDNDCDGLADEENPQGGSACDTGAPGACAAGSLVCSSGGLTCQPAVTAGAEICDGIDNDCDGDIDEDNPGSGVACNTGLNGVCGTGATTCNAGTLECVQTVFPASELCDNLDNDCNGAIDDGNPGGGDSCNTGLLGVCQAGARVCQAGSFVCQQLVAPSEEVCDNQDNDCDNTIDEDFNKSWWWDRDADGFGDPAGFAFQCGPPNAFYVQNASDANDFTQYIYPGRPEICDGADNDQNGVTDENSVCANAQVNGGSCRGFFSAAINRGLMICRASSGRSYNDQRTRCRTQSGMDLALPSSEAENQAIGAATNALFGGFGRMWLGVTRANSGSPWTFVGTGAGLSYTRWDPGEPSGDGNCVEMLGDFEWNDSSCGNNRDEAACEWNTENIRRF
jgi:hypothetical protein